MQSSTAASLTNRVMSRTVRNFLCALFALSSIWAPSCRAEDDSGADAPFTWSKRLWISGQMNSITQANPGFHAAYSGSNSFQPGRAWASSRVLTLFTGFRITRSTEVLVDFESAGGTGLSSALGLAGFTNLDVVRNPTLGSKPYLARYLVRHIIALSKKEVEQPAGPLGVASTVPVRRLELRFGKLSTADFFDLNSAGSDSHLQFMNWTVDNNGAYDYAADTRGYTFGALAEYYDRGWAFRFMEGLMPTEANGLMLDWSVARARSENVELELRRGLIPSHSGVVRFLGYTNHANMGSYREAIGQFQAGQVSHPDVTATRRQDRLKYGFGVNVEQSLTTSLITYGRWGWNEGRNESYAYTEVNHSVSGGLQLSGIRWRRSGDAVGVAGVSNGISGDHRRYLQLGGVGFLLGDGNLNYGREQIVEGYYRVHLPRGLSVAPDIQRVVNPGYNRDRGPIFVVSLRMHFDIDRHTFR